MPIDHYTRFRSEETISEVSAALRRVADTSRPYFNIVDYLKRRIINRASLVDEVHLEKYTRDYPDPDSHASVTFQPTTLHVAEDIWKNASNDDPFARFVLAHELGHLSLHRYDELGYSGDPTRRISFADKEHSVEWQADVFALHFLMPEHLVEKLKTPDVLEAACLVPLHRARERVELFNSRRKIYTPTFTGDCCIECCNFTLVYNCGRTKCDTCGSIKTFP